MNPLNQSPNVNLQSIVARLISKIMYDLLVAEPAKVISYDETKQLVTVESMFIRTIPTYRNNPTLNVRTLSNVPIHQPYTKNGGMTIPIIAGDEGLLIYMDRSKDNWLSGKDSSVVNNARVHNINDAMFIPGFRNILNNIPNVDNNSTTIRYKLDSQIKLNENEININYKGSVLKVSDKFVIKNDAQNWWTLLSKVMDDIISTANSLSQTAQQLSALATALATAQTIPATVGSPLPMNASTIANAQAVMVQANIIKSSVDNVKNSFTQDKQELGELFSTN